MVTMVMVLMMNERTKKEYEDGRDGAGDDDVEGLHIYLHRRGVAHENVDDEATLDGAGVDGDD